MAIKDWDDDKPLSAYKLILNYNTTGTVGNTTFVPVKKKKYKKSKVDEFSIPKQIVTRKSNSEIDDPEIYKQFMDDILPDSIKSRSAIFNLEEHESLYKKKLSEEGINKNNISRTIIKAGIILGILVSAVFIFVNFFAQITTVTEKSMLPTLRGESADSKESGDKLLIEKFSYWIFDVNKGDIVVIDAKSEITNINKKPEAGYIIRRVIGVARDEIEIRNGKVFRNGRLLDESYVNGVKTEDEDGKYISLTVPVNYVYVLGDNRNFGKSLDSRLLGPISVDKIKGKVIFRIFPLKRIGKIK